MRSDAKLKRFEEAKKSFRRPPRSIQKKPLAYNNWGQRCRVSGQNKEAIEKYESGHHARSKNARL